MMNRMFSRTFFKVTLKILVGYHETSKKLKVHSLLDFHDQVHQLICKTIAKAYHDFTEGLKHFQIEDVELFRNYHEVSFYLKLRGHDARRHFQGLEFCEPCEYMSFAKAKLNLQATNDYVLAMKYAVKQNKSLVFYPPESQTNYLSPKATS